MKSEKIHRESCTMCLKVNYVPNCPHHKLPVSGRIHQTGVQQTQGASGSSYQVFYMYGTVNSLSIVDKKTKKQS